MSAFVALQQVSLLVYNSTLNQSANTIRWQRLILRSLDHWNTVSSRLRTLIWLSSDSTKDCLSVFHPTVVMLCPGCSAMFFDRIYSIIQIRNQQITGFHWRVKSTTSCCETSKVYFRGVASDEVRSGVGRVWSSLTWSGLDEKPDSVVAVIVLSVVRMIAFSDASHSETDVSSLFSSIDETI